MKRLKILFRQIEFQALLFCLCLLLFNYPLVLMSGKRPLATVLFALFIPWAVIIYFLFLASRDWPETASDESENRENGGLTDV